MVASNSLASFRCVVYLLMESEARASLNSLSVVLVMGLASVGLPVCRVDDATVVGAGDELACILTVAGELLAVVELIVGTGDVSVCINDDDGRGEAVVLVVVLGAGRVANMVDGIQRD